ncbi:alpha/beta-tubulin-N-acetyltransferase 9-like isoform X2 [Corticium candelabrum]|uniref:alpha/beta-tubulin-N-acetyltransferase 9-like isoform X2 n=1 Tax=Corticium candelabrum TaxID=121492 RepID=UPI002E353F09|nr:alpha/beta-tubulin-N-acetyltransferase 9-like isoform X2 [Corticium candelabrum]
MRLNQHTKLVGHRAVLVPYCIHHVPNAHFAYRYHEWMKSPELLELTASEQLSLEEEYQMQQTWLKDDNKCTFIVLDAEKLNTSTETDAMVGDVNLFLNDPDDVSVGEIEIMTAESSSRRKGIASEALTAMMRYANEKLAVTKFVAKVGQNNAASRSFFQKLEFKQVSLNAVFHEVVLERLITGEERQKLLDSTSHVVIDHYDRSS